MPLNIAAVLRWTLPVTLGLCAIGYSAYRARELQYWDGAVGNWLATLLGIIVGVPVALHLERQRAARAAEMEALTEGNVRKSVLNVLRTELREVLRQLSLRVNMTDSVPIEPLRDSSWEALRAAGSLRYLTQPTLIESISGAYRWIAILNELEASVRRAVYGINVQFPDGQNAAMKLMAHSKESHSALSQAVFSALAAIEVEAGPIAPHP